MPQRQSGLSLIAVAIGMAALAAAAMYALYSMRHEGKGLPSLPSAATLTEAVATPASSQPLRKCTIKGKTVISNTDCKDSGKRIEIHDSRGFESPKAPPKPEPVPEDMRARMLEKATP
jgi:hypothetical protein